MALAGAQKQVAAAIKEMSDCPEPVKQMLLAALPNAFGPNLHKFQKETGAILRKSLEEFHAKAGEAQAGSDQRSKESQAVLEALQADAENTNAAEEARRTVLNEKVEALEAAQAAVKSEVTLCEEAEAAKGLVTVERQELMSAKEEVLSIQSGSFRMLIDGGWEDEEVRDMCIEGVCHYLKEHGADDVLLAALPKALVLRPAECGTFDKMALDEAAKLFSHKLAQCEAKLTEGEERIEDVAAEYTGAWAILDLARETVQEATRARDDAEAALRSATADKKSAQSKVDDQDATLGDLLSESALQEALVQRLDEALGALALLEAGGEVLVPEEENKENAMVVDAEYTAKAMEVEHVPIAPTAGC